MQAVAALVAAGAPTARVVEMIARAAARLIGGSHVAVLRFTDAAEVTVEVAWGGTAATTVVIDDWPLLDDPVARLLHDGAGPVREDGAAIEGTAGGLRLRLAARSAVTVPVRVGDAVWGALSVLSSDPDPVAEHAEDTMAGFAQLIAAAVASAATRSSLKRVVDEQRALRRVAELVARSADPPEVFAAVAESLGHMIGVQGVKLLRYETDGTVTFLASWGPLDRDLTTGSVRPSHGTSVAGRILATGRAARVDGYGAEEGPIARELHARGIVSAVGAPVHIEGELWGALVVASADAVLPADTEVRMTEFADLVALAIGNLESRRALLESRVRLVHTADETRRRLERDLHDGVQQRLVAVGMGIRGARQLLEAGGAAEARMDGLVALLDETIDQLRETSRGLHPAILSKSGLAAALRSLGRHSSIAIDLELSELPRLPEHVEVAAYFVVAEALTNAAKHASATRVRVRVRFREDHLRIDLDDDGCGGADPERGSGLVGIRDRVEALGGTLGISSPHGDGTVLRVSLPAVVVERS